MAAAPAPERPHALAPLLVTILLLLVGLTVNGAFAIRHWAPIGVFVLAVLVAVKRRQVSGPPLVALLAVWAFAGWTFASAAWGESPESAVDGGARTLLYAGLFTLALTTLHQRRSAQAVGGLALVGLAVVVVATFVQLLADSESAFLAGRLDAPIGYRNGTAALFVLAFWPLLCIAAARRVPTTIRAPAFAIALLALGLAYMTQSRGVLIGFAVGGLGALAIGPDRLRRAWLSLVAVGAIALASDGLLVPYRAFTGGRPVTSDVIADAAATLGVLAVAALFAALVLALFDNGLRATERSGETVRRVGATGLAVLGLVAGVGGLIVVGDPISLAKDKLEEFRSLDVAAPSETRLGSTGGQRYDLWRIALREFADAPIGGVGQGSYRFRYYEDRRSDRNLSTPHSLPFGLLAETGTIGIALFGLFLGAVTATFVRGWRTTSVAARRWASACASAGLVILGQSTVDWLWEIPGLAGLGLLALGLATALMSLPEQASPERGQKPAVRAATAALLVLAAVVVGSLYLSDFHTREARAAGRSSAHGQLDAARTADRLNPVAIAPKLLQAGALEQLGHRDAARAALLDARELEPRNFVIYGLLGDLEVRAGDDAAARRWYRRALELNPTDVGLQRLVRRGT